MHSPRLDYIPHKKKNKSNLGMQPDYKIHGLQSNTKHSHCNTKMMASRRLGVKEALCGLRAYRTACRWPLSCSHQGPRPCRPYNKMKPRQQRWSLRRAAVIWRQVCAVPFISSLENGRNDMDGPFQGHSNIHSNPLTTAIHHVCFHYVVVSKQVGTVPWY